MLFESEAKGANFIKFNREEITQRSRKVPLRVYYCSFCCGWHVTSVIDEARIDMLEARDKRKWEGIAAGRSKEMSMTRETSRFLSYDEAVEQYRHLGRFVDMVVINIQKAESDIRNLDLEEAEMHSGFARENLGEAVAFARKNNLHFGRKHDIERITTVLVESFEIIRKHDVNHNTRRIYLSLPSGMVNPYAIIFLRNKDFIEEMDSKLSELETLAKYGINVPLQGRIEEIDTYIVGISSQCVGKKVGKKRKQFERRLALVRTNVGIFDRVDSIEEETKAQYLTVINILEKAYAAYAKRDFNGVRILVKVAEDLIPDENDEIGHALRVQIRKMKDGLL